MFIGLTMGQATGIIPTYLQQNLGLLTESSAVISVDANYVYKNSSLIYILISSLVVFVSIKIIVHPVSNVSSTSASAFNLSAIV